MSADVPTVVLPGPAMVPLVRAAAALEAEDIPPFAVIGGVAVTDQRYTPTALEVLRARGDATYDAADPHTITSGEVQFQDVEPVDDADVAHLDDGPTVRTPRSSVFEHFVWIRTAHVSGVTEMDRPGARGVARVPSPAGGDGSVIVVGQDGSVKTVTRNPPRRR
ncbi:MAG TPA: hypothetical protein PKE05_16920 [Microthrixaceae bacterium]|nr:hypothetical protein [Microthrixaceae bacterium]